MDDYGEPFQLLVELPAVSRWVPQREGGRRYVVNRDGLLVLSTNDQEDLRAYRCANFLAGVPDAVLSAPGEMARMALAVLRGDRAAALALADRVAEEWATTGGDT